jgi:tRNA(Ile)-lysidine synthase
MKGVAPLPDPVDRLLELTGAQPRVAVAFSGGLDSTVLAHALVTSRRHFASLRLLHVDHGLQLASAGWAKHCARQARRWRVSLVALRASIEKKKGESPEAAARAARYSLFDHALDAGEVLVTAQHQDDQAETLLLQLFRGAGVAGLAAMPPIAPFARGRIARPLLGQSRASLERYANYHRLEWIEDPSNRETRFARNFLRHDVLPVLRKRWPTIDGTLARSARLMAEAQELLDATSRADLARAMDGAGLNVACLRALPVTRRRNVLRAFIAAAGAESPSAVQMMEIADTLPTVRADAQPEVRWSAGVMRRRAGRLELEVITHTPIETPREIVSKSWLWETERELIVNGAGDRLALVEDDAGPIDLDRVPKSLELRARIGGESLRPGPRARMQSLKKLMQSARLSTEERARLPLLFGEGPKGRLLAVGDRWIDASIAANVKSRRRAWLRMTRA